MKLMQQYLNMESLSFFLLVFRKHQIFVIFLSKQLSFMINEPNITTYFPKCTKIIKELEQGNHNKFVRNYMLQNSHL